MGKSRSAAATAADRVLLRPVVPVPVLAVRVVAGRVVAMRRSYGLERRRIEPRR